MEKPKVKISSNLEVELVGSGVMKEVESSLDLLWAWNRNRKMRLTLLYKGLRDGAQLADVHSKINGISPTFIFIKSEQKLVFGFYTTIPWTSPEQDDTRYAD